MQIGQAKLLHKSLNLSILLAELNLIQSGDLKEESPTDGQNIKLLQNGWIFQTSPDTTLEWDSAGCQQKMRGKEYSTFGYAAGQLRQNSIHDPPPSSNILQETRFWQPEIVK